MMHEIVTLGACAVSLSLLYYINKLFAPDKLDSFALYSVDNSIVILHSTYCPWCFFFITETLCASQLIYLEHICAEVY